MHANVALDISTMAHAGRGRGMCEWVFEWRKAGIGESGDFGRGKMKTDRERMEIRMDSIMPLCVIPSLRMETSKAGPLATWEPSWELNQESEHNGVQGNRHSVHYKPSCNKDKGEAIGETPLLCALHSTQTSYLTHMQHMRQHGEINPTSTSDLC